MQKIVSPYKTFTFERYDFNPKSGEATFVYGMDDLTFTERVMFPVPSDGVVMGDTLHRALFSLHLIAGISYYKAGLPPEIIVKSGSLSSEQADFWNKLYTNGLGEFFYRNDLDGREYIKFPSADIGPIGPIGRTNAEGAIVPIGGGKDSLVAIELLRKAGVSFELLELGDHAAIDRVVEVVGASLRKIHRTIDPLLFDLNEKGAWNGHAPISAYIAFTSVVFAIIHGKRDIVLANERSANVGNVTVDGWEINHQYSKSLEFERDVQKYISDFVVSDVRYFSLLRPLSELAITKRFVGNGKYFNVFSSCNKNFKIHGEKATRPWCGECPKCAFVFALFAAFVPREELVAVFGQDLFMKTDLIPMYQDLLGIGAIKPFECVGEPEEVIAAFTLARLRGSWNKTPVMDMFDKEVAAKLSTEDAQRMIESALAPSPEQAMPEEYLKMLV